MKAKFLIGLAVATVAIAAATVFAVNHFSQKSHLSDLALANLEALTNNENNSYDNEFKYRIEKDPCVITVTADMDLKKLARFFGGNPTIGASLDLTNRTCIYALGGNNRLGNDVRCADLF
jgi:hypothetical protein